MNHAQKKFIFVLLLSAVGFLQSCADSGSTRATSVDIPKGSTCVSESKLLSGNGIVGGQRVAQSDPDAKKVALLLSFLPNGKTGICTATPIAKNVLLTAAHCIESTEKKSRVALYSSLSCESGFDIRHNTVEIEEFIVHREFREGLFAGEANPNDIALVILKENLPSSYSTHKIANPNRMDKSSSLYFWGYGDVAYGDGGSGILRKTQIAKESFSVNLAIRKVEVDQSKGRGICHGDSGGPGFVKVNGEFQILGVNSYVEGTSENITCANKGFLLLAYPYINWITKSLKERSISFRN